MLQNYTVYKVPAEEEYRLGLLWSFIEIKQDNFFVTFNEEEEEEDGFDENDIEIMINEVCTS